MIGATLALLSALGYSLSVVLVRQKLEESNFISVALVLTVIGNVVIWPIALLLTDFETIRFEGIMFFAIAGILSPGMARLLYFRGMEVVGVSLGATVMATYPMISSLLAVLTLGETLTLKNWVGIICINAGIVYIERNLDKFTSRESKKTLKRGLVFPILAAFLVAFSYILRKEALNFSNEPVFGVAIGYALTLLLYLPLSTFTHNKSRRFFSRNDLRLFWKPATVMALGYVLSFFALVYDKVSIVTPLIQTEPLFVLFFAFLFLRELEKITFRLGVGTISIVAGVMLVSIG